MLKLFKAHYSQSARNIVITCLGLLLSSCSGTGSSTVSGSLAIALTDTSVTVGSRMNGTITLTSNGYVGSGITANVSSSNPTLAVVNPATCAFSTSITVCRITITGVIPSNESITISASSPNYATTTSAPFTVVPVVESGSNNSQQN